MPQPPLNEENFPLTPLQKEALKRIGELEQEIYKDYGLKIGCGIELEFYYRQADGEAPPKPLDLIKYNKHPVPGKTSENSFVNSPFLERLEKVRGTEKYEAVIGRRNIEDDLDAASPAVIARAANHFRDVIEKRTPELEQGHTANFWATDEHPTRPRATAGLHVNVSLWDPVAKRNLFAPLGAGVQNALVDNALYSGLDVQKALFPIIVESPQSLERFKRKTLHAPSVFRASRDGGAGKSSGSLSHRYSIHAGFAPKHPPYYDARLEHRLPGGDADPILATLMAVGGIYHGLKQGTFLSSTADGIPDVLMQENTIQLPYIANGTPQTQTLLTRCDRAPYPSHIDTQEEYLQNVKQWDKDPLAREILGEALHDQLARMRQQQAAGWAK